MLEKKAGIISEVVLLSKFVKNYWRNFSVQLCRFRRMGKKPRHYIEEGMYNKIFIFSLIILLINGCGNNNEKLNSKKLLVESNLIKYSFSFGIPDSAGILIEKIFYNKKGKDSIIVSYDEKITDVYKSFFYYDSLNNLTSILKYDYNGKVYSKTNITYDAQSRIKIKKVNKTNGEYNYEEFYYALSGLLTKKISSIKYYFDYLHKWDESKYNILMGYDKNGNLISEKYYKGSQLSWEYKYKYDSLDRKIECFTKNNPRKYKYDDRGNIIEEISQNENGLQACRWERKYDSENRLVEEIKYNHLNEPVEKSVHIFIYVNESPI